MAPAEYLARIIFPWDFIEGKLYYRIIAKIQE